MTWAGTFLPFTLALRTTSGDITWYVDGARYNHVNLANGRDTLQKGAKPAPNIRNTPFDRP